jgi:hypothetical protein
MLSRAQSDASSRLRRAKSSCSFRRTHRFQPTIASLDPEVAHQHAVAAALRAMELANERGSAEMSRQPTLGRNNSTTSNNTTATASTKPQVVRFVGSSGIQGSRPIRRNNVSSRTSTAEGFDPSESALTAIPQIEDDGLGNGSNSTPSSYRRLRKARSMFGPHKRASSVFAGSTPAKSEASHFRGVGRQSFDDPESDGGLRLRRSLSFLRSGSEQLTRVFKRSHGNDAAIQMARDQFLHQLEQQRLRERPSFLFAPKLRRQQKAFRKTVRSSSETRYGPAITSTNHGLYEEAKAKRPGAKSRSLSASIRNRFKRVFGRSSESQTFPAQQLDATRPHFHDYVPTGSGVNLSYDDIPAVDERSVSRGSCRPPSLRPAPSTESIRSRPGSLHTVPSRESLTNKTSRITSWTDSTPANTIGSRNGVERKRLSVIQEHGGPHQPSSSAGMIGTGYSVFRKPLRSQNSTNRLNTQVDPQRVYSALVKRIDEKSPPKANQDTRSEESIGGTAASRNSSHSQKPGATIRAVPKELTVDFAAAEAFSRRSSVRSQIQRKPIHSTTNVRLTPQQLAQHNEGVLNLPKQQPLREVRSAFFPFTAEVQAQTPSPFKRSLAARKRSQIESEDASTVIITREVESYEPTVAAPRRESSATGSGSNYSRSSSGNTPKEKEKVSSPTPSTENVEPGTAVIITSTPMQGRVRPTSVTRPPMHVSKSSTEWKAWVDSQMAALDRQNSLQNRPPVVYCPPPSHFRENAQIDGDDTQVGRSQYLPARPASRSSILDAHPLFSRPSLPHRLSSETMNDRFPKIEIRSAQRKRGFQSRHRGVSPAPSHYGYNNENQRISAVPLYRPPSNVRLRASQGSLRSERNYSDPRPPSGARSYRAPERKTIVLSSSDSMSSFASRCDVMRPQSSNTLRDNYGRSTPNVLRHTPSCRSGLNNQYFAENRRMTKQNITSILPEKSYDGDDESPEGRISLSGSRNSKRMVDLFLSSRRQTHKQRRGGSSVGDSGSEPAFV